MEMIIRSDYDVCLRRSVKTLCRITRTHDVTVKPSEWAYLECLARKLRNALDEVDHIADPRNMVAHRGFTTTSTNGQRPQFTKPCHKNM